MKEKEHKLLEKAKELEDFLEYWGRSNQVIGPNERIILSIEVERAPEDPAEEINHISEMHPLVFFSVKELQLAGVSKHLATRLHSCLEGEMVDYDGKEHQYMKTMKGFIENWSVLELLRIPNLGKACVTAMVYYMKKNNLPIEGTRWYIF